MKLPEDKLKELESKAQFVMMSKEEQEQRRREELLKIAAEAELILKQKAAEEAQKTPVYSGGKPPEPASPKLAVLHPPNKPVPVPKKEAPPKAALPAHPELYDHLPFPKSSWDSDSD